ncbi:MAG: type II secretion system GspH family protein [Lentisphaeraceae bacterium]|nr:type II secretion system GspH family protein [Lentisphaeraceae bacterium]
MKNKTISKSRFTLIELLVVIAIIGILTGILLPAIAGSMKEGKKTKAAGAARQLALACEAYLNEYGSLPCGAEVTQDTSYVDGTLLDILDDNNPRKKVFFENNGTLKNPFGGGFIISLDGNYDNEVTDDSGSLIGGKVAVWTICDGDTVRSWEK